MYRLPISCTELQYKTPARIAGIREDRDEKVNREGDIITG